MPDIDEAELEAELDALGDELALDEDTSYLDEASTAPNAPTGVPGADSTTNKVGGLSLENGVKNLASVFVSDFITRCKTGLGFFPEERYFSRTHGKK